VSAGVSDYDRVKEAADHVRARLPRVPEIAVVLGSGLGDFAGTLREATTFAYEEIPHWPASKVIGHAGQLVAGKTASGREIVALSGRAHFYEGHGMQTVTFGVRVLGVLGVKVLILTNAAGGINTSFAQGALMVIDDHINLMCSNPLIGPNEDRFGVRFPDMTEVYSKRSRWRRKGRPGSRWSTACTSPCTDRATRRRRRFASSARLAPMPWGCRRFQRRLSRARWGSRCWASPASPTWRPACCRRRSITTR
jgi:Phosphorylase superfamily